MEVLVIWRFKCNDLIKLREGTVKYGHLTHLTKKQKNSLLLWLRNKHIHAWHWRVLPVVDDRVQKVTLVSKKGVSSEPIHTKNILTAREKEYRSKYSKCCVS